MLDTKVHQRIKLTLMFRAQFESRAQKLADAVVEYGNARFGHRAPLVLGMPDTSGSMAFA